MSWHHSINPSKPIDKALLQVGQQNNEGWILKQAETAYYFSDDQQANLVCKFNIGHETGQKIDTEVVAKEMKQANGSTEKCLLALIPVFMSCSNIFFLLETFLKGETTNSQWSASCDQRWEIKRKCLKMPGPQSKRGELHQRQRVCFIKTAAGSSSYVP